MPRVAGGQWPAAAPHRSARADFYREEFLKHQQCLELQREFYSEHAFTQVEFALARIIEQLEHLSASENADQLVAILLRKFDVVTGLSGWTDSKNLH